MDKRNDIFIDKNIFGQQIKILRTKYKLSIKNLSDILDIKSTSNIAYWESNKVFPQFSLFRRITLLFGISADWLIGHSNEPYNETFISAIENKIINNLSEMKKNNTFQILFENLPKKWLSYESRKTTYSLDERADIIFLMQAAEVIPKKYLPQLITKLIKRNN